MPSDISQEEADYRAMMDETEKRRAEEAAIAAVQDAAIAEVTAECAQSRANEEEPGGMAGRPA